MLASDSSSYLSGAMIHVDGGCLAGGKPWELTPIIEVNREHFKI